MRFQFLRIRIATSQLIRQWAQHELSNGKIIKGQILNPKTVNYLTLKPEPDGLFCERIFGPVKEFSCACSGKYLRKQREHNFCSNCEVELISPRVRRYRLGYIQLVTAVAHIWFFKKQPNFFSIFLNLSNEQIESLFDCTHNICRSIFPKELNKAKIQNIEKNNFSSNFIDFNVISKKNSLQRFWSWKKIQRYDDEPDRVQNLSKNIKISLKFIYYKNCWNGGVRDCALFFGFSLVSKMFGWCDFEWLDFLHFVINFPKEGDLLNRYYPGPPGLLDFCESELNCLIGVQTIKTWLSQLNRLTKNNLNKKKKLRGIHYLETQVRANLFEFDKIQKKLSEDELVYKTNLLRRFKNLRAFRYKKINPASIILCAIPVLPPDLRPIIELDSNQIAISDLNKLYQNVIFRNQRLSKIITSTTSNCLNSTTLQYAQKLLQDSVNNLIENTSSLENITGLKSLSDLFKGKKGRFRQNLLGKRVDYSGRSVIVVSPYLRIYECGIPKKIALELFQPFLIRSVIFYKKARTLIKAKKIINMKSIFIWNLLKRIVERHALLLNRAPSLHRLSIQAFLPRLVEGEAILLHPLVCSAFNADFDGDQMGVHIPLCFEARGEAWKIMWSQNNLFSVATGSSVCIPSQDIILGSCFLTTVNIYQYYFSKLKNKNLKNKNLNLTPIWISQNPIEAQFETQKKKQKLVEIRLSVSGKSHKLRFQICQYYHPCGNQILRYIRTTFGRLKFHQNVL